MRKTKEIRKNELLDATVQTVARHGLTGFSTKKVSEYAGVSEALIFKYFGTKKKLLFEAYKMVNQEILDIYKDYPMQPITSEQELLNRCEEFWVKFMDHLIANGNKTIFYSRYRDSTYIRDWFESSEDEQREHCHSFFELLQNSCGSGLSFTNEKPAYLWTYLLDTSTLFAKKAIRGDITDIEQMYSVVWSLLSKGVVAVIQKE